MDFAWFRDLDNLAQTGNFSKAAELGNISQPAFSRRIKAIETWVGVPLVDRSKHPVSLTAAGAQMLEAGRQSLTILETERRQIVEAHAKPDRYVVIFAAQHSIGWRFFPAWLREFETAFGPVISRLRADDLPNCMKDLAERQVDFVIAYSSAATPDLGAGGGVESILIGRDRLVPVSAKSYDGGPIISLRDGARRRIPYLRFGASAPISQHIEPLISALGLRERLSVEYENSMAGALRIRAREGGGLAWLPRSLVRPDLETGVLAIAGGPEHEIPLEVRLLRQRRHSNPFTREIWAFLDVRQSVPLIPDM